MLESGQLEPGKSGLREQFMLSQIQPLLRPPIFEDEEKTRLAALLYKILLATLILPATLVLYFLAVEPYAALKLVVAGSWILLSAGGIFLVHRGRVKLTSLLFTSLTWLLVTLTLTFAGGVRAPAFAGYTTVILLAALLCGPQIGLGEKNVYSPDCGC